MNERAKNKQDVVAGYSILSKIFAVLIRPFSRKVELAITFLMVTLTCLAGITTFLAMIGAQFLRDDADFMLILLYGDLALLLVFLIVITRRLLHALLSRRGDKKKKGMHLRLKMVLAFSLFSSIPTIILTIFSLIFIDLGLENWFSAKVKTTIEESQAVARAYLGEHVNSIRGDTLYLARTVANQVGTNQVALQNNAEQLERILRFNAQFRDISEALLFEANGGPILARYGLTFELEFDPVPDWAFQQAVAGDVAIIRNDKDNVSQRIRALVSINNLNNVFLLVGRAIDPQVLEHVRKTDATVTQFSQLEFQRLNLQISFTLAFILISFLILLAAITGGIQFASSIWRPLEELMQATARIGKGDFKMAKFRPRPEGDEIGMLNDAFYSMASQLQQQRDELVKASEQIDLRRRFTETVLAGVSAGVIGIDAKGRINLPNLKASELLDIDLNKYIGKNITKIIPEFSPLVEAIKATSKTNKQTKKGNDNKNIFIEDHIHFGEGEGAREFLVRIGGETNNTATKTSGFVITFDDLTKLLNAQRQAAWADIARRIAHEVKNPLTPIQLSADRLRRKYGKQITDEDGVFNQCIDTIIRQVGDIGGLIDEFSNFARMPKANIEMANLSEVCLQSVFLEKNRMKDDNIHILTEGMDEAFILPFDRRQLSQALINIIKNAVESARHLAEIYIKITLGQEGDYALLTIKDNGPGFPDAHIHELTAPYFTKAHGGKKEGTGLGLAIVKKIIDDHQGRLELSNDKKDNGENNGAIVKIYLPILRN